jgi:serine/threonine-protein kinase SRPK3
MALAAAAAGRAASAAAATPTPPATTTAVPPAPLEYESRVLSLGPTTTATTTSNGGGGGGDLLTARAKVVDFGNACWVDRRFTDDVQTRQYRSPEVVLGAKWGAPIDVWSLACLLFELATGDFLFDPRAGKEWDRDEDHLALMIELLGRMPRRVWSAGARSRDFFTRAGELRSIKKLKPWPLAAVLREKYRFSDADAEAFSAFLLPMLRFCPEERATAQQMLGHAWLAEGKEEEERGGGRREDEEEEGGAAAAAARDEGGRQQQQQQHARSPRPHPAASRSPSPSPPGERAARQESSPRPMHASAR